MYIIYNLYFLERMLTNANKYTAISTVQPLHFVNKCFIYINGNTTSITFAIYK